MPKQPLRSTALLLLLSSATLTSYAEPASSATSYIGGGVAFIDYSETGIRQDASLSAVYGRIGSQFNETFSGEIRAGIGAGDDSIAVMGIDVNVELKHFIGAYLRAGFHAAPNLYPYALVGYSRAELEASVRGFGSVSGTDKDISYGFGIDLIASDITVNAEYINYVDTDGVELSGFSIGLAKSF